MKQLDTTALVMMLIVGAVAGWLAGVIVGHPKWGLIGSIVAGIIGGVVGGWLLNVAKVNIDVGHPIANSVITGAIGAVVVIILARILG